MKLIALLQLAAITLAIVLPDEKILRDVETNPHENNRPELPSTPGLWSKVKDTYSRYSKDANDLSEHCLHITKDVYDETASSVDNYLSKFVHEDYFDPEGWLESAGDVAEEIPSLDEVFPNDGRPPRRRPGHGHHKPNQTVYQLIASSKYTTKLAELLNDYPDLVETLNGTEANYTVFAPTNIAFKKIPEHAPKPSKEQLKKLLTYHISDSFYPAGRVLATRTIPTLLQSSSLPRGGPQRISINISLRGLTVNFYARIFAINIFGTNGVIHALDSFIIPPPKALSIIPLFPSAFSTLELGLSKTGLLDTLNGTDFTGSTWFLPDNAAFAKLGPRINAFLFSEYGLKYLKKLLEYHVVPGRVLYSDGYYGPEESDSEYDSDDEGEKEGEVSAVDAPGRGRGRARGRYQVSLPTLLEDRELAVYVSRFGRFVQLRINGFAGLKISDGVAKDGVVHVVTDVLIPPKKLLDVDEGDDEEEEGEMTVEELVERLGG